MESKTELIPIDVKNKIEGELKDLLNTATAVTIENTVQRENMNHLCIVLARWESDLEADRKRLKQPHWDNGLAVDGYFKPVQTQVKARREAFNRAMYDYDQVIAKRLAEEKRIADEAAEAERKLLADIEDARLRDEEQLREEAEAKRKEAETKTGAERDALIEQSNTAERVAEVAAAEAADASRAGAAVEAAPVFNTYHRPKGMAAKKVYKAEFKDKAAFIRWCVANNKFHWLKIDEGKVNDEIKANEGQWAAPGVVVIEDMSFRNNTRRAA